MPGTSWRSTGLRRSMLLWACVLFSAQAHGAVHPAGATSAQPIIRYHYGDNPGWASPSFDDSSWPIAANGQVPQPPFRSDGFFWVRVRVPVPPGLAAPLGIQSLGGQQGPTVQGIFVNGIAAGQYGSFPPDAAARFAARALTFPIPAGGAGPGAIAVVALRTWSPPISRITFGSSHFDFVIDRLAVLRTAAQDDVATAFLASLPPLIPDLLLFLLGIALLIVFRRAAGRELLLYALWLSTIPLFLIPNSFLHAGLMPSFLTARAWELFYAVTVVPGFYVTVEFLWTVFRFRDRLFRSIAHAAWIVYVAGIPAELARHPAAWIPPLYSISQISLTVFNAICLGATVWAFFVVRRNRVIAAAFSLINITYLLAIAGLPLTLHIGPVAFPSQIVGFFVAGVTITAMLVYRAVAGWRTSQQLHAELLAAREVQQQLVPTSLPDIAGFSLYAAYHPAAEVGGDFYQVLAPKGGSSLLVIGDVSGKGLKAAMTGTLALGALRAFASENLSPAALLGRLNRELCSARSDGFITCLCVRLDGEGKLLLANAGHLAPYCNGEELELPPGLPLGLTPDADYEETTLQLAADDTLTFLSDGVVEARNSLGELFGFDRTRAISRGSAESIATAAQAFGQEDDITVLTLQFAPAAVLQT
ncbi:MAG: SpoIIE family protein phosphatase [Acidobacteriaceae bacterium]